MQWIHFIRRSETTSYFFLLQVVGYRSTYKRIWKLFHVLKIIRLEQCSTTDETDDVWYECRSEYTDQSKDRNIGLTSVTHYESDDLADHSETNDNSCQSGVNNFIAEVIRAGYFSGAYLCKDHSDASQVSEYHIFSFIFWENECHTKQGYFLRVPMDNVTHVWNKKGISTENPTQYPFEQNFAFKIHFFQVFEVFHTTCFPKHEKVWVVLISYQQPV